MADNKKSVLDSLTVEDKISRKILVWLNTYENLPVNVVNFEQLAADNVGMAMSATQAAYKTKEFITGGYEAEYQFKIIYRIKPGTSNNKRLQADELLNAIGAWAVNENPDVGEGIEVIRIEPTQRASLFAVYTDGDEDHQISLKMTYRVN